MSANANALEAPVSELKGVGEAVALKLTRLGIAQVADLLFHLPLRYQDRTRITPIGTLRAGHEAVVEGEVSASDVVKGRRRSLLVRLRDGSGILSLRFFHFSPAQQQQFRPGARVRCFGEARAGATGLEIYHPEYRLLSADAPPVEDHLTPIYPTTEGLHQARLRPLIEQALARLEASPDALPDWIPRRCASASSCPSCTRPCTCCTSRRPTPTRRCWPAAGTRPAAAWRWRSCWRTISACAKYA